MAKKLTTPQRELLVTLSTGAKLASTWSTSFVVVTEKCTNTTFRFPDGMEKVLKTTVDALDEAGLVEWQKGFCVISEAGCAAIGTTPAPVAEPIVETPAAPDLTPEQQDLVNELGKRDSLYIPYYDPRYRHCHKLKRMGLVIFGDVHCVSLTEVGKALVTPMNVVEQVELSPAEVEQGREIARWRLIRILKHVQVACVLVVENYGGVVRWLSREIARYDALLDDISPTIPTFPLDSRGRYPFVDAGKIAKQRAELDNPLPAAAPTRAAVALTDKPTPRQSVDLYEICPICEGTGKRWIEAGIRVQQPCPICLQSGYTPVGLTTGQFDHYKDKRDEAEERLAVTRKELAAANERIVELEKQIEHVTQNAHNGATRITLIRDEVMQYPMDKPASELIDILYDLMS